MSFNQGYDQINDGDNVYFIEPGDAFGNTGFGTATHLMVNSRRI